MTRYGSIVVAIGVAFLVGGCTAADEPDASTGPLVPAASGPVDGGASSRDGGDASSQGDSLRASYVTEMDPLPPLTEYGVYLDGPGDDPALVASETKRHDDIENAIAVCMADQGFRYIARPQQPDLVAARSRISTGLRYLPVPYLSSVRETVAGVGYGVMATPEEQMAAEGYSTENPNVDYQSSLSSAEADAYSRALQGDWNVEGSGAGQGCSGQALPQYPEFAESDQKQVFEAEFGGLANAARIDVMSDPRAVQLDAEWESCMNRKGYKFEKVEGDHGPVMALGLAIRTRPDRTVGAFHYEPVPVGDIPVEEKSLLGTEPEREVALADFDCRVETDYMARLSAVRVDLDERFIVEHQAELDRLVSAAESW